MRHAEKAAYEKLIRLMSHEVNNTLGASNSLLHSSLSYARLLPPEPACDLEAALRTVIGRTERLGEFMRGFAEVVRLPEPRLAPCDLRDLLERIAVLMRPECERRQVQWRWQVNEPVGLVTMDAIQMEQVFVNVVKNGLEAIGEHGTLTVRLGREGTRPSVVIEDSGPGIPEEAREQLFTPFFSTKESGQGVGLTLVQEILSRHRFAYSLDGPPGGPTRFTVLF